MPNREIVGTPLDDEGTSTEHPLRGLISRRGRRGRGSGRFRSPTGLSARLFPGSPFLGSKWSSTE